MQSIYALFQSKSDDLTNEEKFLNLSVKKTFDLYVLQLLLLVEVKNMENEHLEIKKKKYLATTEDKKPSLKFINNSVIQAIEQSTSVQNYIKDKKLDNWKNDREYVRVVLDRLKENKIFEDYLKSTTNSFEDDKEFILNAFKEVFAPDEKLFDYYESMNLSWIDDLPFVNTLVVKAIKSLKPNQFINLNNLVIKEDDQEYMFDLFRKSVLHNTDYDVDIDSKTPNWDNERIAEVDMILIKMAITEFLYFPSIPTKVTINEYIEIAKDYSTQKSSFFINGVLDKLLKVYQQDKRLNKIGRGLL
ncbi:MAG: transcription antitermination factor NusB [Bacteroidota bacterium]